MNNLFGRVSRTLDNERRFTSDAAHELRTPLAALRMQLQVAQRTQDEGEKQAAVAKALRGAERMTHLVGQLLALARLENANATGSADVFDLSALTEDALRELAPAAADKPCRLEHDIGPELMIHGNPDLVAVLIRNLLDNALRYSATGGRIEVRLMHVAGSIVLRVADDGSGVAVENREKLGSRFQRFSSQAVEGVGLGLSIVRRVAELHGASVAFSDGLDGRGLCVEVRFPDAD
jgi:two-component system sensor histidine kinase QseC